MSTTDTKIYPEYFRITKEYQSQYGCNTVLLMQVGAFFEVYGLKNPVTNVVTESPIMEFTQICQLNVSDKKCTYNGLQVMMAGFRDYTLEKYLQKITDSGFSAVVYVQEKNEKNTKRIFHSIHSPGTFIPYENDSSSQMTNNIMCIWINTYKPLIYTGSRNNMVCGISVANIFTGQSSIFEYQTPFIMNPTTFDELERCLSIYSPSEIILVSDLDDKALNSITQYASIKANSIHYVDLREPSIKAQNCTKQKYIQHMLSTFYGEETYQLCTEFETHAVATQAFCYLLNFIQEHNPNLVRKIGLPVFNNTSDRVILANHTLRQLNIIDDHTNDSKKSGHLSSVLAFLNKCCSPMGRRKFQSQLLNPSFNEEWLTSEYKMIETVLLPNNEVLIQPFRKILGEMRDLDKICRQLVLQKIYPSSIYHLYKSIQKIQQLNVCLHESPDIYNYLCKDFAKSNNNNYIENLCSQLLEMIESNLVIDDCKQVQSVQVFFKKRHF